MVNFSVIMQIFVNPCCANNNKFKNDVINISYHKAFTENTSSIYSQEENRFYSEAHCKLGREFY